uniref:Galactose oxidase n=1 Tax=Rhabditophanes sp. KR3021 TaxID=114890 RepID=A0AC35U2M7_9BILA
MDNINNAFSTSKYNDQIWAFGGWVNDNAVNIVQSFDFEKMIWLNQKALPVASCDDSSVVIDNVIYVTPGSIKNKSMLRYDSRIKNWEKLAEIPIKRQGAAVCLNDSNIMYCGGGYKEGGKWITKDNFENVKVAGFGNLVGATLIDNSSGYLKINKKYSTAWNCDDDLEEGYSQKQAKKFVYKALDLEEEELRKLQ